MAWEWSHTDVRGALENLKLLSFTQLCIIAAEWDTSEFNKDHLDERFFRKKFREYKSRKGILDTETLSEHIWQKTVSQSLCENGGHEAWVCPYGCHKVCFDPPYFDERRQKFILRKLGVPYRDEIEYVENARSIEDCLRGQMYIV